MKTKLLAAAVAGLFIAGCGGGGGDPGSTGSASNTGQAATASTTESQYLAQTYQSGQTQIQNAQAAEQKSGNADVKSLAQKLRAQITVNNQRISQLAGGAALADTGSSGLQSQALGDLGRLSGSALDRAFVSGFIEVWDSLLAATLAQIRQGENPQVRYIATANLLSIEQSLLAAEELIVILDPNAYLADAARDSLFEIQLGQLALQRATNPQVRQFAQRMIDDHTAMSTNVATLATQKNVSLPTDLSASQQEVLAILSGFSGADFDKAYMDKNVTIHAADVSKTSLVAQRSSDAAIAALAQQSLPILQAHLQSATAIDATVQASAAYQLGQSILSQIQLAQFAQGHTDNSQLIAFSRQVVTQNQALYAQLIQLIQQGSSSTGSGTTGTTGPTGTGSGTNGSGTTGTGTTGIGAGVTGTGTATIVAAAAVRSATIICDSTGGTGSGTGTTGSTGGSGTTGSSGPNTGTGCLPASGNSLPVFLDATAVETVLQITHSSNGEAVDAQLVNLLSQQNSQALAILQAAPSGGTAEWNSFVQAYLPVAQAQGTSLAQLSSGIGGSGGGGTGTGSSGTDNTGTGANGVSTPATGGNSVPIMSP